MTRKAPGGGTIGPFDPIALAAVRGGRPPVNSARPRRGGYRLLPVLAVCLLCTSAARSQVPGPFPSAQEVADLLQREPITPATWPAWRERLLAWLPDRSDDTTPAFHAAWEFLKQQASPAGELPQAMAQDAFAWYLLGSAYLAEPAAAPEAQKEALARAEKALRRSLQLDPKQARAHARLVMVLTAKHRVSQPPGRRPAASGPLLAEARRELDQARRADPTLHWLKFIEAELAMTEQRYAVAEPLLQQALAEDPKRVEIAHLLAQAVVLAETSAGKRAPRTQPLVDRFPTDGGLACLHGLALAIDGDARAASRQFDRARALGTDPATVLPPDVVTAIAENAAMPWWERFAWAMAGFAGVYAVIMALMAVAGVLLARWTRGTGALRLLGERPEELVSAGQVARTTSESSLARIYAVALCLGLILFYFAIPFVIAGLLAVTGLLLYFIFALGRIPIKLVLLILIAGLGMAWAVFKSLFTRPATGSFGLPKTAAECPRLHEALADVARRVDTEPVREVFIAPGSAIGVHQEGRGPFGMFGVKRRVLTLGMSTMHYLTVGELQGILAHEYAHFSHRDTFYSRFIYQVELSINEALSGMGRAGGWLNYVNPFFWFLYLYYKTYSMLSAGFSRSREFLADRMASTLYGSDVFTSALTKVCTDGALFEMTIYSNIQRLLEQDKAFINMYEAFHDFRNNQLKAEEREELYQKLLQEKTSLFASHPTFQERVEAVAKLPVADKPDTRPALELFEQPDAIEKELTEFLTGYIYHVQQMQAQAAAAQ